MSRFDGHRQGETTTFIDSAAVVVRRAVTVVVLVTAGLTFAFGFGNGWAVGLQLGVSRWIAPLVAPAVDLSVVGLLVAVHVLRGQSIHERLLGPRLLLGFAGLVTLALNIAQPILSGEYGRACFDAVAPLLLIGWSEVGPKLLAALHGTVLASPAVVPGRSWTVRNGEAVVSPELLSKAKRLDAEHRQVTGRPISRDKLRAALKVSNAVTGEVLRLIRTQQRQD
jgi:hypothetical protein